MPTLKVQDADELDVHLASDAGAGTQGDPLVPTHWIRNLGVLLATLADADQLASARTKVAAALQFYNGATLDMVRGSIANGLLVDVTRVPTALQNALEAIRDRLPAALVGGRLDVNIGASADLTSIIASLANIAGILSGGTGYLHTINAVDTAAHAFPDQVVKGPVYIYLRKGSAPVTIDDGTGSGTGVFTLEWDDTDQHHQPLLVIQPTNLSQFNYQFGSAAAGNGLSISSVT